MIRNPRNYVCSMRSNLLLSFLQLKFDAKCIGQVVQIS